MPVIIDTTHNNVNFKNQNNGKIPSSSVIYQQTMNSRDLCYQCSKHDPDFYLVNLGLGILETNHIFLQK